MIKINFDKKNKKSVAYDDNNIIGECIFIENKEYWNIIHTEVDKLHQGKGIARKLVEKIIKEAKKNNKILISECSYAKRIIEEK